MEKSSEYENFLEDLINLMRVYYKAELRIA
jgi:hypothetical protein